MKKELLIKIIENWFPIKVVKWTEKYLIYAGIYKNPKTWLANNVILIVESFIIGFIVFNAYYTFTTIDYLYASIILNSILFGLLGGIIVSILTFAIIVIYVYYKIIDRTNRIDDELPDFIMMLAANIRSGMTPYDALKTSSRRELGPLKKEIDYMISQNIGTSSLSETLHLLSERTYSKNVSKFVNFFDHAIRSGGRIADTLETAANEMTETKELKTKLWTTVRSNVIFLLFVVVIALPFLLSISEEYVIIFKGISNTAGDVGQNSFIINTNINISEGSVEKISSLTILITSFLVGITIGVLKEGKLLYGLKYWPIILIISYTLFKIFGTLWTSFFGGII